MKRLTFICLTSLMLVAMGGVAHAGSGKAIVPHWQVYQDGTGSNNNPTFIFLSNITTHDLVVNITMYNLDGTMFTNGTFQYNNFHASNTEIMAGESAYLKVIGVIGNPNAYGYAVIEWENKNMDHDAVGLVAWGMKFREGMEYNKGYSIPINSGNPF